MILVHGAMAGKAGLGHDESIASGKESGDCIDIDGIHIEARIHRCKKSDLELEDSFLEDPEPNTILSASERSETMSHYKETVYLSREFKPGTICSQVTTERRDPKSPAFSKDRRHSFSVNLKQSTSPDRFRSTITVYPDSKKTYVSTVQHQLCQKTKCWSVSDADENYRYDDPGRRDLLKVNRRESSGTRGAVFLIGGEPFLYEQHEVNGISEDDVFS